MQVGDLVRVRKLKKAYYANQHRRVGVVISEVELCDWGDRNLPRFEVAWFDEAGATITKVAMLESRLEVVSHAGG